MHRPSKTVLQIMKRDIHIPELMNMEDLTDFVDYPPRLLMYVEQTLECCRVDPAAVNVAGLDLYTVTAYPGDISPDTFSVSVHWVCPCSAPSHSVSISTRVCRFDSAL